jgi:hypothetical protein
VKPLIAALGTNWYFDEQAMREALDLRSSFNLIDLNSGMKIDVFVPKLRRFDGGQFARALRTVVDQATTTEIPVGTAEDIIVAKLEWFRKGQEISERQWGDILGVLRMNAGKLNIDLLRESAEELGVNDLLNKAMNEAGAS